MVNSFTFPQSGDRDDAENFASMIGQSNLSSYVETGLGFTYDSTVPDVQVSDGKAFVSLSQDTASSTGETVLEVNHVVQIPQQTLSLTSSALNYIYVEPNLDTDDNGTVAAYTDTTNAATNALLVGTIDTSSDTVETRNRSPEIEARRLLLDDDQTIEFGDDNDFSIDYDSTSDELELTDEINSTTKQTWDKNGDTFLPNGDLVFGNNLGVVGENTSNTEGNVIRLDSSDNVVVGDSAGATQLTEFYTSGSQAGYFDASQTFWLNGALNLSNSSSIQDSGTAAIGFSGTADVSVPNGDLTDGTNVIYDQSASEIPDSAMGSIANSTLTNSSVSVAGNSVSLGGSISVDYIDLNDTGNSFPIPNTDLSNSSISVAGNSVSLGGTTSVDYIDLADTGNSFPIPNADLSNSSISVAGNSVSLGGTTSVDYIDLADTGNSFPIPNADLSNDTVTVAGNGVSLGGSINVDYIDLADTGSSFPIPNADLSNSSVSVAGQSVSLGGSTTLGLSNLDDYTIPGTNDMAFSDSSGDLEWPSQGGGIAPSVTINTSGDVLARDDTGTTTVVSNSNGGTVVSSSTEYEIQKNGTDGAGVINLIPE